MTRAKRWWLLGAGAAMLVVAGVVSVVVYQWQMPRVRERLVAILSSELGAEVELAAFDVTLGREVHLVGEGLVLHHKAADPGLPPLAKVRRFVIVVPVAAVVESPVRVRSVDLDGLEIFVPKRRGGSDRRDGLSRRLGGPSPVVIAELRARQATLALQSGKPDRPPRTFAIHDVRLADAAFDRPTSFTAKLTNPKPTGEIDATGQFGPWVAAEPSATPVSGSYTFARADLGTIKGIGGTLESAGGFSGPLDQIDVKGETETPDFTLQIGGRPMSLATAFVALVDGTSGDTILHDVDAMLGQTPIKARGGVVHTPGRKGRTVTLQATIDRGQLHDVLRLALDESPPPMDGRLSLRSMINLPPGEPRVVDRLELDAEFTIDGLRFASDTVQDKVDEFSRRGRGRPTDAAIEDVASTMRGTYRLKDGVLRFRRLRFGVRGATVLLDGRYVLAGGALDFRGTVRLDARASQTMTGWKSWLTKVVDPLLAKDGAGTVLPIKITGTASQPKFGVEVKKIF